MSKLEKGQMPFAEVASIGEDNPVNVSVLNRLTLIETAFHSFPEIWKNEAFALVFQNKQDFKQQYGIMIPQNVEDSPDFDPAEVLAMQIVCNRYAVETVKNNLTDHHNDIIERLIEIPVMKMRIQSGEFNSIADEASYEMAA